jgi:hypothetical protein
LQAVALDLIKVAVAVAVLEVPDLLATQVPLVKAVLE